MENEPRLGKQAAAALSKRPMTPRPRILPFTPRPAADRSRLKAKAPRSPRRPEEPESGEITISALEIAQELERLEIDPSQDDELLK